MSSITYRGALSFLLVFFAPLLNAAGPKVTVSAGLIGFRHTTGSNAPASQAVVISADAPVSITPGAAYITGTPGWLNIPSSEIAVGSPAALPISINPAGLSAGTYAAQIRLSAPLADPASSLRIVVFLRVDAGTGTPAPVPVPPVTISAAPTSLAFAHRAGDAPPAAQSLAVAGAASIGVTVSTTDGYPWLVANPANAIGGIVTVSVAPSGVVAGTYTGRVTLTAGTAVTNVPVTLTVTGPNLSLSATSLSLTQPQHSGLSPAIAVQASAPVATAFTAGASSPGSWLQVDPVSGTTPTTLSVRANNSGLAQGVYQGTITVQPAGGAALQLPVTLTVGAPATVQLVPSALLLTAVSGDSSTVGSTVKVNSVTGSSLSYTIATNPADSWLTAEILSASTPGEFAVFVRSQNLAAGTYTSSVTVTPSAAGSVSRSLAVSLTVTQGTQPVITGITSAASYAGGAVAPGQIVTIWGANMGPGAVSLASPGPAAMTVAGTSVTFDGIPAPVLYASASQVAVQIPYGIAPGQTVLRLAAPSGLTTTQTLTSTDVSPGLFTLDSSGQGPAAALNQDLSVNSPANPVARGSVLVLYGTGEGKTEPPTVEGTIIGTIGPFSRIAAPVSVTIGGKQATVHYAGVTPSAVAGLMQVNITVPDDAPSGNAIPVQIIIGGVASQTGVTVAVN